MKSELNGVLLKCEDTWVFKEFNTNEVTLEYKDENSGEYECHDESLPAKSSKIYVKFRSKFGAAGGFLLHYGFSHLHLVCVCVRLCSLRQLYRTGRRFSDRDGGGKPGCHGSHRSCCLSDCVSRSDKPERHPQEK